LVPLFAASCGDDPFAQVVEVDLPEHTSRPAVSVEIVAGQRVIRHAVSRSYGILEDEPREDRATRLLVYRNGEELASFEGNVNDYDENYYTDTLGRLMLDEAVPEDRATYRIDAFVAGIGDASAEQRMPAKPVARIARYDGRIVRDADGFTTGVATVEIDDPADEDNYYAVRVVTRDSTTECTRNPDQTVDCISFVSSNTRYTDSPNLLTRYMGYNYGIGITDESFSGQSLRLEVNFDVYEWEEEPVYQLEVISLTEDGYRYLVSFDAYDEARYNPFAEPVTVHNFIEGGYGYLIVSNKAVFPLEP
jgi:hypothetical protein